MLDLSILPAQVKRRTNNSIYNLNMYNLPPYRVLKPCFNMFPEKNICNILTSHSKDRFHIWCLILPFCIQSHFWTTSYWNSISFSNRVVGRCELCSGGICNEWVEAVEWFIWGRRVKKEATVNLFPMRLEITATLRIKTSLEYEWLNLFSRT